MATKPKSQPISLIVTDIDNTVFDWVKYYVHSFGTLLHFVEKIIKVPYAQLAAEAREVFSAHGSIEYPFLIQELPSVEKHYGTNIDKMLNEAVEPGRLAFMKTAEDHFHTYEGVIDTLARIKSDYPDLPVVALTDAPRYVAMWKLNKLGVLGYFNAVYGLADPRIPTCEITNRVKVDPEILLKHLQQSNFGFDGKIRILPDEYEKPGVRGLKTVLMDFELDEKDRRHEVLWIGDNLRKDVGLGSKLGVQTVWASYGAAPGKDLLEKLAEFSPPQNIHKNAYIKVGTEEAPKPDHSIKNFRELLEFLP